VQATAGVVVNIGLDRRVVTAAAVLAAVHALFDYAKARFSKDTWLAFTVDQAGHLSAVAVASVWLKSADWSVATAASRSAAETRSVYLYLCAYVGVVFGGGFFVQRVTQSFLDKIGDAKDGEGLVALKPGLPDAGMYIGWLERFLILTFVVGRYGEAVGFLLAAKALARYPEIKEDTRGHFAEYFLVGTFDERRARAHRRVARPENPTPAAMSSWPGALGPRGPGGAAALFMPSDGAPDGHPDQTDYGQRTPRRPNMASGAKVPHA
jgi:hypothetical protein